MTQVYFEETKIDDQKIIFADCFDVMKSWPNGYVDAVLTSPPFRDVDLNFFGSPEKYYVWYQKFIKECCRISRDYVFALNSGVRIKEITRLTDWERLLIWNKGLGQTPFRFEPIFVYCGISPKYNIGGTIWSNVITCPPLLRYSKGFYPNDESGKTFELNSNNNQKAFPVKGKHPYENPVKLYVQLLRYLKKGGSQTILDPCLGSGTTLEACLRLNLKGIGIEKERIYYDLAIKRLEVFRGQERLQFESTPF